MISRLDRANFALEYAEKHPQFSKTLLIQAMKFEKREKGFNKKVGDNFSQHFTAPDPNLEMEDGLSIFQVLASMGSPIKKNKTLMPLRKLFLTLVSGAGLFPKPASFRLKSRREKIFIPSLFLALLNADSSLEKKLLINPLRGI